jgi:hypothetical protein
VDWLFENPVPAVIIGSLSICILAGGWLQTGQRWLLYLVVVVLASTVGAVLIERAVVTDRESVKATLYQIADLVEKNDIDGALQYAYSGSAPVHTHAKSELPGYRFSEVKIKRNLEIDVFPDHIPPKAVAEFNVVVRGTAKEMLDHTFHVPRFVEVVFYQEDDGRWRVGDYRHYEPQRGFSADRLRRPLDE